MQRHWTAALAVACMGLVTAAGAESQTGSIEFAVRLRPTAARPEPVMRLPIHLLRKSFADIQKEAEESVEPADLDKFVDGLSVSTEMKDWMKRTKVVRLSDPSLITRLQPDDVFTVPEFFEAYIARNAGDVTTGFPAAKYRERDKTENPVRYERQVREYREALRKHLNSNPHTLIGVELELQEIDPGPRWAAVERERAFRVRMRTMEMAERRYHVAKTETDLEGRGGFVNVAPGNYWLTSLDGEGRVGDIRLRWDVPVSVGAGRPTSIELNNLNGTRPPQAGAQP